MTLVDDVLSAAERGARGVHRLTVEPVLRARLAACGRGTRIAPRGSVSWRNVYIGQNTSIGPEAIIWSTRAKVLIGSHVMFGPRVTIISGDHRTDLVGRYMNSVGDSEKTPADDLDVVIEDDVWIGASAIILKGVVIGEGSVIAAGSVVSRSVPPYSIAAGASARVIRPRFTEAELAEPRRLIEAAIQGDAQPSPPRRLRAHAKGGIAS